MKRFFSIFLVSLLIVSSFAFTGCSEQEDENKLSVNDSVNTNYEQLAQAAKNIGNFDDISAFLAQWAKDNNITVRSSSTRYIVLTKSASPGYEKAETFTFHCSIAIDDEQEKDQDLQSAAAVMAVLYSADRHGELTGIFTAEKQGKPVGATALGDSNLDCDNFISINYSNKNAIINSIAASSEILASRNLPMTSPQYTKAYKIVLKGTPYRSPYLYRGDYPNAIKTIGDLLASCQSSSVLFELASFNGGTDFDLYPAKAQAIIVLQENDVESFTSRFENSYERVSEYYEELDEPFEYTMTETKMPKQVIAEDATSSIVSFMYTLVNGAYLHSDDGEVMAFSNIGKISTKNEVFHVEINAKSLENTLMDEMHNTFKTTCGLCDIEYHELSTSGLWYASEKIPLIEALSEGMKTEPSGVLENKAASVFLDKKSDLNLVIWNTDIDDSSDELPVILDYMESFADDQTEE